MDEFGKMKNIWTMMKTCQKWWKMVKHEKNEKECKMMKKDEQWWKWWKMKKDEKRVRKDQKWRTWWTMMKKDVKDEKDEKNAKKDGTKTKMMEKNIKNNER